MAFCFFCIVVQDVKNCVFVTEECDADVKRRNVEKCLSFFLVLCLQGVGSRGRLLIFFLANEFDSSRLKAYTEAMNVYTSIIKFVGVELSSSTINKNKLCIFNFLPLLILNHFHKSCSLMS